MGTDILRPSQGCCLLHGNTRLDFFREYFLFVSLALLFKDVPRGHADDAGLDAFVFQSLISGNAVLDFASACDQDYIRLTAGGIGQDVRSFSYTRSGRILGAIKSWHWL